jgi:hypothetical protein
MAIPVQAPEQLTVPRCCPIHPSLQILTEHLVTGFPRIAPDRVVAAVVDACKGTTHVSLIGDTAVIATVEVIARYTLTQLGSEDTSREVTSTVPRQEDGDGLADVAAYDAPAADDEG